MIITSANVNTSSAGSHEKTVLQRERVETVPSQSNANSANSVEIMVGARERSDFFETNMWTFQAGGDNGRNAGSALEIDAPSDKMLMPEILDADKLKMELIRRMFSALRGERFTPVEHDNTLKSNMTQANVSLKRMSTALLSFVRTGDGVPISHISQERSSLVREEFTSERESVSYSANGRVITADGKTIDFTVSMNMSRSTETYLIQKSVIAPEAPKRPIDPLIINYGGTAASLTDEKFEFDLTCDGNLELISFAGAGSGFLVLDKNGDGIINDGSEMFGPQSGNGFEELRKYDLDGNGWIDEADEVYSQLRIWTKDKDGNDVFYTLKELDIGAIYLNENRTEYGMYDTQGNAQGNMRYSSFYLKDSGGAGIISHFDLLV
jgi:hypothetical protein